MNVAVVCSGLGHVIRGAERFSLNLVNRLRHKSDVNITLYGGGDFYEEGIGYVKVPTIKRSLLRQVFNVPSPLPVSVSDNIELSTFAVTLTAKLPEKDFDIILNGSFQNIPSIRFYQKIKEKKTKHVLVNHGGLGVTYLNFTFCDHLIAINPIYQMVFERRFKDKIPVSLIPIGIDVERFRRVKVSKEDMNLPDKFTIFSSSALIKQKRIDALIRAASLIQDAYLLIASTGPEMEPLKRLGKELMGEKIRFLGRISEADLIKYYSVSDVFCLPSVVEPLGIVLLEAMSCGLPVVTNNSYIQRWMLGNCGSCVDVRDVNLLAEALEKYKNKKLAKDEDIKGRRNVEERFSSEVMAEDYYALFKKIV